MSTPLCTARMTLCNNKSPQCLFRACSREGGRSRKMNGITRDGTGQRVRDKVISKGMALQVWRRKTAHLARSYKWTMLIRYSSV